MSPSLPSLGDSLPFPPPSPPLLLSPLPWPCIALPHSHGVGVCVAGWALRSPWAHLSSRGAWLRMCPRPPSDERNRCIQPAFSLWSALCSPQPGGEGEGEVSSTMLHNSQRSLKTEPGLWLQRRRALHSVPEEVAGWWGRGWQLSSMAVGSPGGRKGHTAHSRSWTTLCSRALVSLTAQSGGQRFREVKSNLPKPKLLMKGQVRT